MPSESQTHEFLRFPVGHFHDPEYDNGRCWHVMGYALYCGALPNADIHQLVTGPQQTDIVTEARGLLAKATPEPWRLHSFGGRPEVQGALSNDNGGYPCRQILTMGFAHVEWSMLAPEVQQELTNNAVLIARAPELLRQLADEVEMLRKQIKTMQREAREDAMDAAAEARWQERQGEEYGSY